MNFKRSCAAALTSIILLVGCGNTPHPDSLRGESTDVYQFTGTKHVESKGEWLHFTNLRTGTKVSDLEERTGTGLRFLGWLNEGDCYQFPLSEDLHKEVECPKS